MPLSAVKTGKEILSAQVAEQVISYIQENQLECGDRLPNEKELAAKLSVSRSTIREAMRELRSRGIVVIKQGSGTYVSEKTGVPKDPLGLAFRYDNNKTLAELLDIRFLIEPTVAARCAERATAEQKKELHELSDSVTHMIHNGEKHAEKDAEFHCTIARFAGNDLLNVLYPNFLHGIRLYSKIWNADMLQKTIESHERILKAIDASDGQAAYQAMWQHLEENRVQLNQLIELENSSDREQS